MGSRWSTPTDPREAWRRTTAIVAAFLVFGFVVLMVLLGQNLIAATVAAGATATAAANLARHLASGTDGDGDQSVTAEEEPAEAEAEDAAQ